METLLSLTKVNVPAGMLRFPLFFTRTRFLKVNPGLGGTPFEITVTFKSVNGTEVIGKLKVVKPEFVATVILLNVAAELYCAAYSPVIEKLKLYETNGLDS